MLYDIIYQTLLILASAAFVGEVFERFGLPSVAGELLNGLILGPTVLGVVPNSAEVRGVSTISLFFVVFLIGLGMRTETIRRHILGDNRDGHELHHALCGNDSLCHPIVPFRRRSRPGRRSGHCGSFHIDNFCNGPSTQAAETSDRIGYTRIHGDF